MLAVESIVNVIDFRNWMLLWKSINIKAPLTPIGLKIEGHGSGIGLSNPNNRGDQGSDSGLDAE